MSLYRAYLELARGPLRARAKRVQPLHGGLIGALKGLEVLPVVVMLVWPSRFFDHLEASAAGEQEAWAWRRPWGWFGTQSGGLAARCLVRAFFGSASA